MISDKLLVPTNHPPPSDSALTASLSLSPTAVDTRFLRHLKIKVNLPGSPTYLAFSFPTKELKASQPGPLLEYKCAGRLNWVSVPLFKSFSIFNCHCQTPISLLPLKLGSIAGLWKLICLGYCFHDQTPPNTPCRNQALAQQAECDDQILDSSQHHRTPHHIRIKRPANDHPVPPPIFHAPH